MTRIHFGGPRRIAAATVAAALLLGLSATGPQPSSAAGWSLKDAAAPYKGTTINVVILDRPS